MRRSRWLVPGFVLLVLLGGTIGVVVGSMHAVPVRVLTDYPVKVLAEEAATMSRMPSVTTPRSFIAAPRAMMSTERWN